MRFTLTRNPALSNANGTFGALAIDGVPFCLTVEQPWAGNLPDHSCVPVGDYQLIPYESQEKGPTVVLHNPALGIYGTEAMIPHGQTGRTVCEIHAANWPSDLQGCIGVGSGYDANLPPHGPAVTDSRATFAALKAKWGDRSNLTLTIIQG